MPIRLSPGCRMLRETQLAFQAALMNDDAPAAASIRAGPLSAARRIEIYRHNVFSTQRGALADLYPITRRIVGAAFFDHLADAFIRVTPSPAGDLNQFGREWSAYLAAHKDVAELPYLPDVARLEWHWHGAFHAADAAAFDVARLASVPAEQHGALRFQCNPATVLMTSRFPLFNIWQVNQPDYAGEMTIDWEVPGDHLVISREGVECTLRVVAPAEYAFLQALLAGEPLEAAADAGFAGDDEFDLQSTLIEAIRSQLITDLRA
jgi:hypothetical protein